jgi:hypothetical protein
MATCPVVIMATKLKPETVQDVLDEMDAGAGLAGAMALAFAEIEAATKSATNPHFKSKYADLGAVIDAVKPPLIKYGLFFTQRCHPSEGGVCVETVLHYRDGDSMPLGQLFVPANKNDAQGFGSALTYARRYALQTAFGVPTEDDDGNAAASRMGPLRTGTERFTPHGRAIADGAKEVIDNCKRRFPAWWETGEGMPAEFVPLKKLIEQTRSGLAALETAE